MAVVWAALALLVVVAIVLDEHGGNHADEHGGGTEQVFAFTESDLGAVEVVFGGRSASLVRDDGGQWFVHTGSHRHGTATASDGAVAEPHRVEPERARAIGEQLTVTARMAADRTIEPGGDLERFGLRTPRTMFAFYRRTADGVDYGKPIDVLYVGDLLPSEFAYYTMKDGDPRVWLVPRYHIALLLQVMVGADLAPTVAPRTN